MRKLSSYFLVAVGILIVSSVAQAAGNKVALFATGPTNRFVAAVSKSFLAKAEDLGLEVTEFDNSYDPAVQVQQIDAAIARDFDMLAIMSASETAIIPALVRAKQAGIPVVLITNDVSERAKGLYVSFVGESSIALGRIAGESLLGALKERGQDEAKVALITGSLAEGNAPARVEGFKKAIAAQPGVEIVAIEDAYWDTAKSEQIAGQLFARFAPQGGLDAIYAMADNQAVAVQRAAQAAGIPLGVEKGKLVVVSSNCNSNGLKAIKAGKQYSTATQVPTAAGEHAAQIVADHLAGKKCRHSTISLRSRLPRRMSTNGCKPAPIRSAARGCDPVAGDDPAVGEMAQREWGRVRTGRASSRCTG